MVSVLTMVANCGNIKMPAESGGARIGEPSQWIARWANTIRPQGMVLDLACGTGRHTRLLLERGFSVLAVDRDLAGMADLAGQARLETLHIDLEDGAGWKLGARKFDGIVVANYLHRPIMSDIVAAVGPGGMLIYETFALGNERFGKPSNPDFLLRPGELLEWAVPALTVLGYEQVLTDGPRPALMQRLAARRPD